MIMEPSTGTAGIYLHIPFCKQACHYCNFHFSTGLQRRAEMTEALIRELHLRQHELNSYEIASIYFGGGTPSLLPESDFERLFTTLFELFTVQPGAEITLEANPDDLTDQQLAAFRRLPINRLSIGIQSFSEADLQFMNRAHSAREALHCIDRARRFDFEALTIDLIYGTPTMDDRQWAENIRLATSFEVPHLSCYALTVEPRTALHHFVRTGKQPDVDDGQTAQQFLYLMEALAEAGYEHYEISNFARSGTYSRHNTNYWFGQPYLGIGPSAHSFDGNQRRRWNVANNSAYLNALNGPTSLTSWFDTEILSPADRYNEYVMTRLRTTWGCHLPDIRAIGSCFERHFLQEVNQYSDTGHIQQQGQTFCLNKSGKLLADRISSDLFYVDSTT